MRAIDIVLFLFFINLGIGVASYSLALYNSQETVGITPGGMENEQIDIPGIGWIPKLGNIANPFANPGALLVIVAGIVGTTFVTAWAGLPAMQIVPLAIFGGVFWWMWNTTAGILSSLFLPTWLIDIITVVFIGVFFIGILQFSSGRSTEVYE